MTPSIAFIASAIGAASAPVTALYESAILFGIRKQLQAEEGKEALKKEIAKLEAKKKELTNKVSF